MAENIFSVDYWRERLDATSPNQLHRAVYICHDKHWGEIEKSHREILKGLISPLDSVLDVGCGWGRLIGLMPEVWFGSYLGMDLSPDFIRLADQKHPDHRFWVHDVRNLDLLAKLLKYRRFDWCVLISMKHMVIRNAGQGVWDGIEEQLKGVAKRLLFLEYDPDDPGTVLEC